MRINRILSIFIALFILSGCELNIDKLIELKNKNEILSENNNKLREELKIKNAAIKDKDEEILLYLDEIKEQKSGIAQERADQLVIMLKLFFVAAFLLISYMLLDFYYLRIKEPKKEEIEEYNRKIDSENSAVGRLKAEKSILNNNLREIRNQIQLVKDHLDQLNAEAQSGKIEAESMQQAAIKQLEKIRAEILEVEKKRKLLDAFKKK